MQFEQAKNPDVQNLDQWRMVLPDGNALFLDPATGETLEPDSPPEWIRDDPRLAEGYLYLAEHRDKINVKVLFGIHTKAEDLGNTQAGYFENQVQQSDAYGFEAIGWDRLKWLNDLGSFAVSRVVPRFSTTFTQRSFMAAAKSGVPSFSYDVESTTNDLDIICKEMADLWLPAMRSGGVPGMTVDELDWFSVHNVLREWYMVGKLGFELKRMFPDGPPAGKDVLDVFMTVGDLHRDFVRKLSALGVNVKTSSARRPGDEGDSNALAGVISAGVIPWQLRHAGKPNHPKEQPMEPAPATTTPTRPAPAPESRPTARASGTVGDVGARVKGNAESLPLDGVATAMAAVDARIGELYGKMAMAPDEEREGLQAKINQLMSARAYLGEAFAGLSQSRDAMEQVLDNMGLDWRVEGY